MEENDVPAAAPEQLRQKKEQERKSGGMMRQGCIVVVLIAALIAVSAGAGMLGLYSLQQNGFFGGKKSDSSGLSCSLDRKQICELAFVQSGLLCDTGYECKWKLDIPLVPDVEMGKAVVKVRGVFLAKYGIDPEQVKLWEFYPATSELQMSVPPVKLLSIQTESQEICMEDESWLKRLQKEDRNEAMQKNRLEAETRAGQMPEADPAVRDACIERLRKLLASVGVRLVLVEPAPTLG